MNDKASPEEEEIIDRLVGNVMGLGLVATTFNKYSLPSFSAIGQPVMSVPGSVGESTNVLLLVLSFFFFNMVKFKLM